MAIVQDLQSNLLGMIGIEAEGDADAQTNTDILNAMNSALQKIRSFGDFIFGEVEASAYINAPAAITGLALTQGAKTLTGTGLASWMHGCSVVLSGDGFQNRIIQTGSTAYALLKPYMGTTTAAGTGTVYHDAVLLDDEVSDIRPPVLLAGEEELFPAAGHGDMMTNSYYTTDHGRRRQWTAWPADVNKTVGTPEMYKAEENIAYTGKSGTRMALDKLPAAAGRVDFYTRQCAVRVTDLDSTVAYLVPHNYNESILFPIARFEFGTNNQHFAGDMDSLVAQKNEAERVLRTLANKTLQHTRLKPGVF